MSGCWDGGDEAAAGTDAAGRCSPASAGSYVCGWEGCQLQLDSQQKLVEHVTVQHVQVASGSYRCLWRGCSRRRQGFNARYKMFVHIRTHTKERPHVCADCGKGFSRQENLKIHKRTHTGEKPYSCTFEGCDRAYSNSSDRFKHTRTHYSDRPYACRFPGCVKSYTDPSSLRKHMKSNGHHRQQETPPAPPEPPIDKARKHDHDSCRQMVLTAGGDEAAEMAVPVAARNPADCGCGGRVMNWDPWIWYPWVQHVEQILCAHAQTDQATAAGVVTGPASVPLDLRLLPS